MEAITIAIIGTAIFGTVTAFAVFVRQLQLSRDKQLNDKALQRAIKQEVKALEKIRKEMESATHFNAHYKVLGNNKGAILYLDKKIEAILKEKKDLVCRYADMALKQSGEIIEGRLGDEKKQITERLRKEMSDQIAFYDQELEKLQARRASIWDSHNELQDYLIKQEQVQNEKLDKIYHKHSGILEKVYIRHSEHHEKITSKMIDAGNQVFTYLTEPLKALLQFFNLSAMTSPKQASDEMSKRHEVADVENDLNNPSSEQSSDEHTHSNLHEFDA